MKNDVIISCAILLVNSGFNADSLVLAVLADFQKKKKKGKKRNSSWMFFLKIYNTKL